VKLSVVFETARFPIVLCLAFLAKSRVTFIVFGETQSETVRLQQYTAYSEKKRNCVFSAKTPGEAKLFPENARRVKLCVLGENAVILYIGEF
jgi:hypothetical protein